jgi:hypothetical protein
MAGVALPASTDAWRAALGWLAGDAAPWIPLIAVTLASYVVIRSAHAAAWAGAVACRTGLPAALEPYARRVFGAPRGLRQRM